jgi:hypothetical protein
MRYRRRTFIPMFCHEQQIGHLIWRDGAMEAWTAAGAFVGSYPTRHEASSALWAATAEIRSAIARRSWIDEDLQREARRLDGLPRE